MALPLKLQLAEGFREVAPRACGRRVLWEDSGHLRLAETTFAVPREFGFLGGVDCPITVDAARGLAWGYCCQMRLGVRDFSEIREFDLATGANRRLVRLGLHQWAIWLLAHWPEKNALLAMVATNTRISAINIRHHLAIIDLRQGGVASHRAAAGLVLRRWRGVRAGAGLFFTARRGRIW